MDHVQVGRKGHRGIFQVEEIQPPALDVAVPGGQVAMEEAISTAAPVVPKDDVHALLQGIPILLLETADAVPMAADEAVVVGILEGDVLSRLGDEVAQTFPVECAPLVQRGGVPGLRGGLHEKMYIVHAPTVGHPRHIVHPHAVQLAQHLLLVAEESCHIPAHRELHISHDSFPLIHLQCNLLLGTGGSQKKGILEVSQSEGLGYQGAYMLLQCHTALLDAESFSHSLESLHPRQPPFQQLPLSSAGLVQLHGGRHVSGGHQPHLAIGVGDAVEGVAGALRDDLFKNVVDVHF